MAAAAACWCATEASAAAASTGVPFSTRRRHQLLLSHRFPATRYLAAATCSAEASQQQPPDIEGSSVVVTRERGKNGKLVTALSARGVRCVELPLIQHRPGPDLPRLEVALLGGVEGVGGPFDWVVLTSPEAATVFLTAYRDLTPARALRVAVVGEGTGEVLRADPSAPAVAFTPSTATAKVLAAELPADEGAAGRVLYPASSKAGTDLEQGLAARGFLVTRLNTYSTQSATGLDPAQVDLALAAPVATFASPTAVRAWVELVACRPGKWSGAAACIGSTSAVAARKAGLSKVYFPDKPGLEGWVESVLEALRAEAAARVVA